MLGLPKGITACLFDLDGVLTNTAELHRAAWKQIFDAFLRGRSGRGFVPFSRQDYLDHVDARSRLDGVRSFLASRGITLPEGAVDDAPMALTVNGIGNRKNEAFRTMLAERGVTPYAGSVRYLQAVRSAGLRIAVVTSSKNGAAVLEAAGLDSYVQARIDGQVIAKQHLRGKPEPDSFLAGANALSVEPAAAAVFEDALAGVEAGHAGGFGLVVGVDRTHHADALRKHGADIVVSDLGDLVEP